jgi:hypothetical protein
LILSLAFAAVAFWSTACSTSRDDREDTTPEASPPADAAAIRDVDFTQNAEVQADLRRLGSGSLDLKSAIYADLTGDGREEAVLPVTSEGTLGNIAYLVVTLRDASPRLILSRSLDRSSAGGLRMSLEAGNLVETAAVYGPEDAFCCPSFLRVTRFRWDGARLQVAGEDKVQQPKGPKS